VRRQTEQHAQLASGKAWGCMGRKERERFKDGGMGGEETCAGGKMKGRAAGGTQEVQEEGADVALQRRIKKKER
jgi:hypothetical protein